MSEREAVAKVVRRVEKQNEKWGKPLNATAKRDIEKRISRLAEQHDNKKRR